MLLGAPCGGQTAEVPGVEKWAGRPLPFLSHREEGGTPESSLKECRCLPLVRPHSQLTHPHEPQLIRVAFKGYSM